MTPLRVIALLPTFDNAATLGDVIERVLATGVPALVVNDGATDATADVLTAFGDRVDFVTHATNQGKAAALRTGFARAGAAGYTHAVTIDTDGQHDPADAAAMIALAAASPRAIVLGVRDTTLPGYPWINRLGRWATNTLVRFESGLRVADSQCGLRVYPIAAVLKLPVRSGRYDFETEVLTHAAWAGVPVVQTPVRCEYAIAGGRVSHFRPWRDSLRAARLHINLVTISIFRRPGVRQPTTTPGPLSRVLTGEG